MNKIMNTVTIKTRLASSVSRRLRFGALGALLGAASLMPTTALGWNYSNVPLFWVQGIKPNVVLMIDNSGSMQAISTNEAYQRALVTNSLSGTDDWYWCDGYDNSAKACTSTDNKVTSGFSVYVWNPPTIKTNTNTASGSIDVSRNLYNNATSPTDCSASSSGFFWNGNVSPPVSTTTYTPILGICSAGNAIPDGAQISLNYNAYKGSFTVNQTYYVVNSSPNGFQLALTSGGAPVTVSVKLGSGSSWGSPTTFGFNYSYNYITGYGVKWPGYINQSGVSLCNVTKSPGDKGFYLGESGVTTTVSNAADLIVPAANEVGVIVRNGNDNSRDSCVRWKMATTSNNTDTSTPAGRDYVRYTTGTLYDMDTQTPYGNFLLNSLVNGKGSYNFDNSSVYPDSDTTNRDWDTAKDITIKNGGALTDNKYTILPNVTRMEAARESAQRIVLDFYDKMNIGLFTLNKNDGVLTSRNVTSVADGTNPTAMKQALIGTTEGMTPADLPASAVDGSIGLLIPGSGTPLGFTQTDINNYYKGSSSPVKYRCQKNYAVVMTDGDPTDNTGNLDDEAQIGYDTDIKTSGNDADGKSWNDPTDSNKWKIQNVVPYTIGLGLENNLLKRTPLVNKVSVPISSISNSVIELENHGLTTGDYVQVVSNAPAGLTADNYYYAVVIDTKHFKLAGAGTTTTITQTVDTYDVTTTSKRTRSSWWNSWNYQPDVVNTGPTSSSTGTSTSGGITGDTGSSSTNTRSSVDACLLGTSTAIPAGAPYSNSNTISDTGWTGSNTSQTKVTVVRYTTTTPGPGTTVNGGCAVIGSGSGNMVLSTGPGKSFFSFTPDQLAADMGKVFNSINNLTSSASAVSTNTKQFNGDPGEKALVYQARFNTEDWSGEVVAYPIQESGGKVFVDTSKDATKEWTTIDTLASAADRKSSKMFTWNPTSATGVGFAWANLDASQQAALGGATVGPNVISWLQGNNVSGMRTHSNKGLLGDILNSDPIFVSSLNQGYTKLPAVSGTGYDTYDAYATASKSRTPMIYVGANDGMLHGLDAATGEEQMTFLPNAVYQDGTEKKLLNLTSSTYDHRYFVDGNVVVGDAYAGGTWSTYLVSGLGRGGKSVFALDVNSTSYTAASTVKWEFTNPDLGYSYGTPIIARLANNKWYAIFPNGLDSSTNQASVFLVNLADATDFKELKTPVVGTPNGMMAVQVKINSQRTVTDIYAGDMQGKIWKWDVYDENGTPNDLSDDTANLSPSTTKLFTAASGQVITGGIRIGVLPNGVGTLVFFGTGKYFETGDAVFNGSSVPQVDSFYAVLDNGTATGLTKADLVQQTFSMTSIGGEDYRTASANPVNYTGGDMGWYIDLLDGTAKTGERIVSTPVLYGGRVIVVSIKPLEGGTCGGEGSSWLNEFDAMTGNMLSEPPLDTNNDGKVDSTDTVVASAKIDGLGSDPSVVLGQKDDYKIIGSTSTNNSVQVETESKPKGGGGEDDGRKGRMSWRQLQ